jgi:hypothetical protein
MGPLVPFIISEEFSLVLALLIGIAFGFILEQAGFSSTKKLVGLFYGYDFTVLRVFFTAGITAMAGVLTDGTLQSFRPGCDLCKSYFCQIRTFRRSHYGGRFY